MFDIPSIRIGKVFGIPIEVNLSWLVIFALVAVSLRASFASLPGAESATPFVLYVVGGVTALLFFASVLAHELCHSIVTRLEGGGVEKITLFIFGGVAQIDEEPRSPGREFLMAAAGPAASLVIAGVAFIAYLAVVPRGGQWWLVGPLQYLSSINFLLAAFNLLPGFPLDGGRVLRSILWGATGDLLKATRWAARSGQLIGWTMVAVALFSLLNGRSDFIWFGLVGWFIAWLAGAAYRQQELRSRIAGVTIRTIMSPSPEYVDGDLTLERLAEEHLLGGLHSRYPVMHDGAIVGLVSLPDVKAVARPDWPFVRVADVTDRDLAKLTVAPETPLEDALARLTVDRPGALLVVEDGRMVGIITRADLIHVLQDPSSERPV